MKEYTIKLDSVDKIKDFVTIASKYPFEIDICSKRYIIDAKSIMGILSLDTASPLTVKAYCDDCSEFEDKIRAYLA